MAQLPITAYLSHPGQPSKRGSQSGSPKVSPKRRRSQAHDREAAPSRKKRKQKENLTPQASLQDVESKLDEPIDGARHGPRRRRNSDPKASTKDPEDSEEEGPVNILDDTGLDRAASKAIIDERGQSMPTVYLSFSPSLQVSAVLRYPAVIPITPSIQARDSVRTVR